jgi:hypothetical protein
MPVPNQLRVIVADQDIRFNAVLDRRPGIGDFHAQGYRRAAEVLVRRFLEDPHGTAGERDSLVLPILFLFRHYLEIRFKDIIVYGRVLSGKPAQWRRGHDLQALWEEARQLCEAVYGADVLEQLTSVGECVVEVSQLDPDSTSFRYPRDAKGRPLFEHLVIGFRNLRSTIASVGDCLDGVSMDMSVRVQNGG